MTNIIHQCGLGDFGKRPMLRFEPAGEVEEVVRVDAKRSRKELPEALTIEEGIRPIEFSSPGCHALDRERRWRARQTDRPRRASCASPTPALQQLLDALQIRSRVVPCSSVNRRERGTRTPSVVGQ